MLHEAVAVRARRRVGEVALERGIDGVEHAAVVAVGPEGPRDHGQRAVPRGAVAPHETPARRGHDAADVAVRKLRVADVAQPLLVGGRVFETVLRKLGGDRRVAGPPVLLAVRAVRGIAVGEVRAVGAVAHPHERVERLVGTREGTDRGERGVHDARRHVLHGRRPAEALDEDVLEAVVGEARLVHLAVAAGADVAVRLERGVLRADVAEMAVDRAALLAFRHLGVQAVAHGFRGGRAVLVRALVVADRHHVALLLPAQREAHPAGHVLGERDHVRAAAEVLDGTRLERAHHLGAGTVLGRERALRTRHLDRAHHAAFEVGHRRIVSADHLALADAVVAHRARHLAPRAVGRHRLARAVGVRDLKLRDRAREVAPRRHVEVPRGDGAHVVPAVAHEDPQRVCAGLEVAVEAIGGVEDAVVEHRGRGVEHLRADLRAVEGRLVEAHARHVQDGGGDGLRHGEGLLERGRGVLAARDEPLRERGLRPYRTTSRRAG